MSYIPLALVQVENSSFCRLIKKKEVAKSGIFFYEVLVTEGNRKIRIQCNFDAELSEGSKSTCIKYRNITNKHFTNKNRFERTLASTGTTFWLADDRQFSTLYPYQSLILDQLNRCFFQSFIRVIITITAIGFSKNYSNKPKRNFPTFVSIFHSINHLQNFSPPIFNILIQ